MASQTVYMQLTDLFRELFDDDAIVLTPETTADDIEGWNSLMHVNLILAVELRFKVKFKTSEIEAMHNIGHLANVIETKLDAAKSRASV